MATRPYINTKGGYFLSFYPIFQRISSFFFSDKNSIDDICIAQKLAFQCSIFAKKFTILLVFPFRFQYTKNFNFFEQVFCGFSFHLKFHGSPAVFQLKAPTFGAVFTVLGFNLLFPATLLFVFSLFRRPYTSR